MPRIVPNPLDNTLLIQATPQDYQQILKLLKNLDVSPRQVLIEAKIYEVSLTENFSSGVQAYLQKRGGSGSGSPSLATNLLQGSTATAAGAGLALTAGALVGQTRELLAFLSAQENTSRAKIISAPSIIATDSIIAKINVGEDVPTLTSQAITGAQVSGSSLFANTVQNQSSGVTLNIVARINPSGIVTLVINQEVSAPVAPAANSAIQSPSFSKRTVETQVTVQDGDTIAIAGIIQETATSSSAGVPLLHRIPILGAAFGSKSVTKDRTELIIFMTPRVIYDTNQMVEATDELKSSLKRLMKIVKE
jgi:general secretion pathway protein D